MKTNFTKTICFLLLSFLVLPSCSVYNFYEYESSNNDSGSSDEEGKEDIYIPTENERMYHEKYDTRTYKSVVKNPNFKKGLSIYKRVSSETKPNYPLYTYDETSGDYVLYPNSSDKTSNEFIAYNERSYLLFDSDYEAQMDGYYRSDFNYPDELNNQVYRKINNQYELVSTREEVLVDGTQRTYSTGIYTNAKSSSPLPNNGRSLSCTDDFINDSWYLSEWWRPDSGSIALNATHAVDSNGVHSYKTDTREIRVNPNEGELRFVLDSGEEYGLRNDNNVDKDNKVLKLQGDENNKRVLDWSHQLVEQVFGLENLIFPSKTNNVYIDFDFKLNSCDYTGLIKDSDPNSPRNAAQIYLYLSVADFRYFEKTNGGLRAMWIGMPIFDSRYNVIEREDSLDANFSGATNNIIFKAGNTEFLSGIDSHHGLEKGKKYHVHYDILPLIKNAFEYAFNYDPTHPASFAGSSWDDLAIYYMNYGYELPGAFKLDSTISNIDIYSK